MSTLPAPDSETLEESGPITAEGLLRRRAQQKPDAIALINPPNRQILGLTGPRSFTYAQADDAVDALAGFFIELGLEPGDRIVLQLPNFTESPLVLLAAWRAGLTVAAVPMLWRANEIARVCDALEPKALIGASRFAKETPAEMLRDVAFTRLSVRFVLGFGRDLPDGVASLDEMIDVGLRDPVEARPLSGPSLITFTARANDPLVPLFRHEDEILAQGAMAVLSLSLDRSDVILNAYPFTGPIGLGLGLAPWLIAGAALVQHHPFDYGIFVQQILTSNATVTALPSAILAELGAASVLRDPQCKLRRVGGVWSPAELADPAAPLGHMTAESLSRSVFDLYPLGDLASLLLRPAPLADRAALPIGPVHLGEDDGDAVFVETRLVGDDQDLMIRGPVVPQGKTTGPVARDDDGFVATGLRGETNGAGRLRAVRDPELIHHGGFTIAASELDGLYQAFPGFLDAACFVLPDPIVGDRIFGAVSPFPSAPVSLEALHRFLMERGVAPYKFPDKLLVVRDIPRDRTGRIVRDEILKKV